jgi:hypothetical protein
MRPLDRLSERMDERQAKLVLYPPRALHQPGSSSAIIAVSSSGSPPRVSQPEPYDQEDDRVAAEGSWPHHG